MCDHLCGSFHILSTSYMKLTINSVNWINSIMICREQNSEFCGILVILNLQIIHMWVLGTFITNPQLPVIYLSLWTLASFTFGVGKAFILDRPKQAGSWRQTTWTTLQTTWTTCTTWGTTLRTTPWSDFEGESLGQLFLCFTLCQVVKQEVRHLNKYRCKDIVFFAFEIQNLKSGRKKLYFAALKLGHLGINDQRCNQQNLFAPQKKSDRKNCKIVLF